MSIKECAAKHRFKCRKDSCDDVILVGKQGHIAEYSGTEFCVLFTPGLDHRDLPEGKGRGSWTPKRWNAFKRAATDAGMTLRQNGDSEGLLSFDPANKEQLKLAIKIAGVRPKRQMSEKQLAHLATIGFKVEKPTVEAHYSV
jgi:hypothetical protein